MRTSWLIAALALAGCSSIVSGKLDEKPSSSAVDASVADAALADAALDMRITRPTERDPSNCDDNDGDGFFIGKPCPGCVCPIEPNDCDDWDPDVYPGANKGCGVDVDFDCNGTVDEDETFSGYVDKDHDGFGTEQWGIISNSLCAAHDGAHLAPAGGDCNDEAECDLPDDANAWWVSACPMGFTERTCE